MPTTAMTTTAETRSSGCPGPAPGEACRNCGRCNAGRALVALVSAAQTAAEPFTSPQL